MMLRLASSISAWPGDQRICESRLNWAIVRPGGAGAASRSRRTLRVTWDRARQVQTIIETSPRNLSVQARRIGCTCKSSAPTGLHECVVAGRASVLAAGKPLCNLTRQEAQPQNVLQVQGQ